LFRTIVYEAAQETGLRKMRQHGDRASPAKGKMPLTTSIWTWAHNWPSVATSRFQEELFHAKTFIEGKTMKTCNKQATAATTVNLN